MVSINIIMNIIISFILEIYTISLEESQLKKKKTDYAGKIRQVAPTEDQLEELIRKAKLYDQIQR